MVEKKAPSAERGNAHERVCKLFTPSLLKIYQAISLINKPFGCPSMIDDDLIQFFKTFIEKHLKQYSLNDVIKTDCVAAQYKLEKVFGIATCSEMKIRLEKYDNKKQSYYFLSEPI